MAVLAPQLPNTSLPSSLLPRTSRWQLQATPCGGWARRDSRAARQKVARGWVHPRQRPRCRQAGLAPGRPLRKVRVLLEYMPLCASLELPMPLV